jgi:hypothetical protein
MAEFEFKSDEERREYDDLVAGKRGSPLLLPLILTAAAIIRQVSGSTPVITEIWRPAGLYGYASVHEVGRGVDFRTHALTGKHIEEICRRVNETFAYRAGDGRELEALAFHSKGTGAHLHGQVPDAQRWKT